MAVPRAVPAAVPVRRAVLHAAVEAAETDTGAARQARGWAAGHPGHRHLYVRDTGTQRTCGGRQPLVRRRRARQRVFSELARCGDASRGRWHLVLDVLHPAPPASASADWRPVSCLGTRKHRGALMADYAQQHGVVRHSPSPDDQYLETPPGSTYEHTDAHVGPMIKFGLWLLISAVVVHIGLSSMYWLLVRRTTARGDTPHTPPAADTR